MMLSIRRGVASYCCGPKLFAPLVSPWGGFPSEIRAKSSSTNNADTRQTDPNVTKEHLKRYTSLSSRNIDKLTPKQVSETWYSYFGSASIEDIDKHIREPNETKHAKADLVDFSMNMQGYQDDTETDYSHMPEIPDHLKEHSKYVTDSAYNTQDSEGQMAGAFGDDIREVPPQVLDDISQPHYLGTVPSNEEDADHHDEKSSTVTSTQAFMTPDERELDNERRRLKDLFMRPVPIPNKPLWHWDPVVLDIKQTANVLPGGIRNSTMALVLVGNYNGGVGYGVGKHKEPEIAVKKAVEKAVEDAIYVSTYRGQFYHDLVGKKNNCLAIIRSRPPAFDGHANWLLTTIMDFIGAKHYSAKITGPKRKNIYTVVQAIFDAFNYHQSFEEQQYSRGMRVQSMGSRRHNPRTVFPNACRGPSYLGVKYKDRMNTR